LNGAGEFAHINRPVAAKSDNLVVDTKPMQRIIVATDGSPGANRAVDAAAGLAKAAGAELFIFTVGGSISGAELRRIASIDGDVSAVLEAASDEVLERARKRALRMGVTATKLKCGWGDPAETIINAVQREKADVLVVGRRGHGRLSGLLLGSVSQKLASLAPCNVIVVP
jgi:nucleotide-binding universal stress UspA family protein